MSLCIISTALLVINLKERLSANWRISSLSLWPQIVSDLCEDFWREAKRTFAYSFTAPSSPPALPPEHAYQEPIASLRFLRRTNTMLGFAVVSLFAHVSLVSRSEVRACVPRSALCARLSSITQRSLHIPLWMNETPRGSSRSSDSKAQQGGRLSVFSCFLSLRTFFFRRWNKLPSLRTARNIYKIAYAWVSNSIIKRMPKTKYLSKRRIFCQKPFYLAITK